MSTLLGLVGLLRLTTPTPRIRAVEPGACPTERATLVKPEEVDGHRALGCASYEGCLDTAYWQGWKSWTCRRCPHFAGPRRRGHALPHRRPALRLVPGAP